MKKYLLQSGQSVVEILVAICVFTIVVATILFLILDSETASRKNLERVRAVMYAEEGLEAARSLRDNGFTNLANGTYGLVLQGGVWTLQGSSDTTGNLTRTIDITNNTAGSVGSGTSVGAINGGDPDDGGTIKVCAIVIDANKNQNTGLGYATSFRVTLRKPNNGATWTITFTLPLVPTENVLSDSPGNETACVENIDLPYGQYSYNAEVISGGGSNWQTVTYNDQYTAAISTVNDFYAYGANLDSNGLIDITSGRKDRALVMLNKLTPAATAQASTNSVKQVTSTVTWPATPTQTQSVSFTGFFANWNRTDVDRLGVTTTGAVLASGTSNKGIRGIFLGNSTAKNVTIDKITLTWNKPSSLLTRITIGGTQVYSSSGSTSNVLLDVTNYAVNSGSYNVEINNFLWTQSMAGVPITVKFTMTDGSFKQYSIPGL